MTGRKAPSRQQLHYNKQQVEAAGRTGKVTQAQALIDHLKDKVKEKKMRYISLYHEITETTLLATTKYAARAKAKEMEAEADKANRRVDGNGDCDEDSDDDNGSDDERLDPDLQELEDAAALDFSAVDADGTSQNLSFKSAKD